MIQIPHDQGSQSNHLASTIWPTNWPAPHPKKLYLVFMQTRNNIYVNKDKVKFGSSRSDICV